MVRIQQGATGARQPRFLLAEPNVTMHGDRQSVTLSVELCQTKLIDITLR